MATHIHPEMPCAGSGTRGLRIEPPQLVHVSVPGEPAFILNLSERGMAIQAMEILEPGRTLHFAFPLPESGSRVEGVAKIVWADRSGRAGLEFTEIPEFDRFLLRQWVVRNRDAN
jgi:PilZ domain